MERWRSNSGVVLRKRRSFPVTGRKHLGTGKSHELQMVRAMLVALKETFSSRRDWHHLSFPILVRPPSKPCSLDKALERNSISRARRLHSSLWFDNRGLISWRGAFGLFFMPRDLFQFPDCCAAGEVSGLGAVVRRFSSFNLRSVRLQRKRGSLHTLHSPAHCIPFWKIQEPGAEFSAGRWVLLSCVPLHLFQKQGGSSVQRCPVIVWTPCCLRVYLVPIPLRGGFLPSCAQQHSPQKQWSLNYCSAVCSPPPRHPAFITAHDPPHLTSHRLLCTHELPLETKPRCCCSWAGLGCGDSCLPAARSCCLDKSQAATGKHHTAFWALSRLLRLLSWQQAGVFQQLGFSCHWVSVSSKCRPRKADGFFHHSPTTSPGTDMHCQDSLLATALLFPTLSSVSMARDWELHREKASAEVEPDLPQMWLLVLLIAGFPCVCLARFLVSRTNSSQWNFRKKLPKNPSPFLVPSLWKEMRDRVAFLGCPV